MVVVIITQPILTYESQVSGGFENMKLTFTSQLNSCPCLAHSSPITLEYILSVSTKPYQLRG